MKDKRSRESAQPIAKARKSGRGVKRRVSRPHRLYRGGKISDARFRTVLEHFVRDHTAAETARAMKLSPNSVNAMFRKIRIYFFEAGLFMDWYGGTGEAALTEKDWPFERDLLAFHFGRLRKRRGVKIDSDKPDYHLAESWWRLDFAMIMRERPSEAVYDMMLGQLAEVIRVAGPVGGTPGNLEERRRTIARLVDQKILWFLRNGPRFAQPQLRDGLNEALTATDRARRTVG